MRKLASLVMVLAACGDDSPVRHLDGGMTDSPGIDIDAAVPQPVTLTVTVGGQPQANVRVYFQASDSSLISSALTDATGVASALMPSGGYVTAIDPFELPIPAGLPQRQVITYAGVKSGDHLVMAEQAPDSQQITVTGATDATAGVVGHYLRAACGYGSAGASAAGPMTWDMFVASPCPTTDFLLWSQDNSGSVVHWAYAPNAAVSATVDLTASALTNTPTAKTYTINNVDDFNGFDIDQRLLSPRGEVWSQSRGAFDPNQNQLLAATLDVPAFTNAVDLVNARGYRGGSEHWLVSWGPFAASYTVDAAARALSNVTAGPQLDTTTHQITWTQEQTGVTPDFVAVWGYAGDKSMSWQFRIIAPYGANVTMPTLPTDDGDYNISEGDSYNFQTFAMGKVPGGYDVVRPHAYEAASALGYYDVPSSLVLSATGSATFELWQDLRLSARSTERRLPRRLSAPSDVGHTTFSRATDHK